MFAVPVLLLLVSCCFAIFLRLKLKHFTLVGPAVTLTLISKSLIGELL